MNSICINTKACLRAATVVGLLLAILLTVSCGTQRLQTVNDETEANEILDVLLSHGIKASKLEVGEGERRVYEIQISGGELEYAAAIQLMDDHCLPQRMPAVIESSGLVSSLEVEKSRELRRKKINIESLLRKLPGATCVDVNLVEPEDKSLSLDPYTASATVLVKYKTDKFDVNTEQVAKMVAGSVPGLSSENVFVTLTRQPLRPLPDLGTSQNLRRLIWIVGLGFTTILLFVGIVYFMRSRKSDAESDLMPAADGSFSESGDFSRSLDDSGEHYVQLNDSEDNAE